MADKKPHPHCELVNGILQRVVEPHCQGSPGCSSLAVKMVSVWSRVKGSGVGGGGLADGLCTLMGSVLFQAAFKVSGSDITSTHGALHVLLKEASVILKDFSSLFIQWVFWIRLQEQILQAINNRVYR